jgi:hypothetical protein
MGLDLFEFEAKIRDKDWKNNKRRKQRKHFGAAPLLSTAAAKGVKTR